MEDSTSTKIKRNREKRIFSQEEVITISYLSHVERLGRKAIRNLLKERLGLDVNIRSIDWKMKSSVVDKNQLNIVAKYLKFKNEKDAEIYFKNKRESQRKKYTLEQKKLILGLLKFAKLPYENIARILKRHYNDFAKITRQDVINASRHNIKNNPVKVTKEEVEKILGVNIEELRLVYPEETRIKDRQLDLELLSFVRYWLKYVGGSKGLHAFIQQNLEYDVERNTLITYADRYKEEIARFEEENGPFKIENFIKKFGYSSVEELRLRFETKKDDQQALLLLDKNSNFRSDFSENEILFIRDYFLSDKNGPELSKKYFPDYHADYYEVVLKKMRNKFKIFIQQHGCLENSENKKADPVSFKSFETYFKKHERIFPAFYSKVLSAPFSQNRTPITIAVLDSLVHTAVESGVTKNITIRIKLLEDTKNDTALTRETKELNRALVYAITAPGKLETILNFWRTKDPNIGAITLEVNKSEKRSDFIYTNVPLYKRTVVDVGAKISKIEI